MGVNQRYNIKVNPPQPTKEEVNQHKNFNRILSQYNRSKSRVPLHQSLYKVNKLVPVIIVTILIILIVFYYHRFKNKIQQQGSPKSDTSQICQAQPTDGILTNDKKKR